MIDGELKKRILAEVCPDIPISYARVCVHIDEAKKAFPVLDIGETANDLLEGLGAFHLAVIVWKKEWLGDGK